MRCKPIRCKTILTKSKLPSVDYCYNVYIGCTHACQYCYAEFMKKFTGHINDEWGQFVDYKENALELLEKEIKKVKNNEKVLLGSVTDSYQPIEKKLLLTRKSLEIFLKNNTHISILTKSVLVLRDIDILSGYDRCEVGISCGFLDKNVYQILEPRASNPYERIMALRELKHAGIRTYLFISPIIPLVSDIESIFSLAGDSIDFAMAEILNTKCNNISKLRSILEKLVGYEKVSDILELCKDKEYLSTIQDKFEALCRTYKVENKGFFAHNN